MGCLNEIVLKDYFTLIAAIAALIAAIMAWIKFRQIDKVNIIIALHKQYFENDSLSEIREKIVWEGKAPDDLKCSSPIEIKKYSTGIAAAWQVVEKIRGMYECKSHNGIVVMSDPDGWYAEFPEPIWSDATEKTAPLAICRAVLLATLESDE